MADELHRKLEGTLQRIFLFSPESIKTAGVTEPGGKKSNKERTVVLKVTDRLRRMRFGYLL